MPVCVFPAESGAALADELLYLGLNDLHVALGGKMVPFAGYSMPVQYPAGVMKEHLHTRVAAGLFDVSHMGQVILRPKGSYEETALAFESLMPVDVLGVKPGRQRYGLFTNEAGGILDDLMFANRGDHIFVVVNAACKHADIAHMTAHLSGVCEVLPITDRALLALQGPQAETALARLVPEVAAMKFMDVGVFGDIWVSRSGYTGEDGFEISIPQPQAEAFATKLLDMPEVLPIGLGARDSLRLEAGLCLYGHDIDTTTSPVEAGLTWAIQKARRAGGAREGGFPVRPASCASWRKARRVAVWGCAPRAERRCANTRPCSRAMRLWAKSPRAGLAPVSRPPSPWAMCPQNILKSAPSWTARCGANGWL